MLEVAACTILVATKAHAFCSFSCLVSLFLHLIYSLLTHSQVTPVPSISLTPGARGGSGRATRCKGCVCKHALFECCPPPNTHTHTHTHTQSHTQTHARARTGARGCCLMQLNCSVQRSLPPADADTAPPQSCPRAHYLVSKGVRGCMGAWA